MSMALSQIEIEQFLSQAHAEFQSSGFLLKDYVRQQAGVKGAVLHFPVFGEGIANQKSPQDDVVPLNISNRDVTLTLQDWYAPEYVDRSFQQKIAVNAVDEYVKLCSYALARRADQMIIDVAEALTYSASPTSTQGTAIAAGGTGFTFSKFLQTKKALRARSANLGKKVLVIDAEAEEDLLNEEKLTSAFYVNQKAIAGDGLNGMNILGMDIVVIPDMSEAGLTAGKAYAWNEMALGYGYEDSIGGDISWENVKASYLVNMWLSANAVVIDPKGVVEISYV